MVGFGRKRIPYLPILDGSPVKHINADLSHAADLTTARPLPENRCILWSIGTRKDGSFDVHIAEAVQLLSSPTVHAGPNSRVVKP